MGIHLEIVRNDCRRHDARRHNRLRGNIRTLDGVGDGYLAMELLDGESLAGCLARGRNTIPST